MIPEITEPERTHHVCLTRALTTMSSSSQTHSQEPPASLPPDAQEVRTPLRRVRHYQRAINHGVGGRQRLSKLRDQTVQGAAHRLRVRVAAPVLRLRGPLAGVTGASRRWYGEAD